MVMCTICGTIWNDQDMFEGKEHKCKEEDIPQRNEIFRVNGIKETINYNSK